MNILSIDGGGIRGIIPGKVLVEVEKQIQEITGDENKRIADYFDLIAGTNTGALLTLGLLAPDKSGKPKFSTEDLLDIHMLWGDVIYDVNFWKKMILTDNVDGGTFDNSFFKEILGDVFCDLELKDLLKPCLVSSFNIRDNRPELFNKLEAELHPKSNFYIKDIAYAASATPTYFEPAYIKSKANLPMTLVDGGVFANNPAMSSYAEARRRFGTSAPEIKILSLGTGFAMNSITFGEAKQLGLFNWARPLISMMMSGSIQTVHLQLSQLFEAAGAGEKYLRVDGELNHADSDFVNARPENMKKLEDDADEIVAQYSDKIREFLKLQ